MAASEQTWKKFGARIRRERLKRELGIRELAARIHVSSTYLSQVEGGSWGSPSEPTIIALAHEFGLNPDSLLAAAGKLAPDLREIIVAHPVELGVIIRACTKRRTLQRILNLITTEAPKAKRASGPAGSDTHHSTAHSRRKRG